jgi:RNA polymerase sigma factor (TIGR02999 family)
MDVTGLLKAAGSGDKEALEQLAPVVYEQLRLLAHRQLRNEFGPRTLCTTALVHEAYLKIVDTPNFPTENRGHFFAVAARAMRHIMISEARRRGAQKRGSGVMHFELDENQVSIDEVSAEILSLDDALQRLQQRNHRLAQVVECRFFAGLSVEETAEAVAISPRTVKRDWRVARAWLYREMSLPALPANP